MNNLDCWPFLVSANRDLDYRTIVAPDFMCEVGDANTLANTAGGKLTGENVAFYREIHKSKVGKFTIVFRVIETTLEDMGIEGSGVLKDSFGREIRLTEGIVIKGLLPDVIVTKDAIEMAHGMIIQPYYPQYVLAYHKIVLNLAYNIRNYSLMVLIFLSRRQPLSLSQPR